MDLILWIIAVVLVISGIFAIFRGQIIWGIVLIVVGLLVGPGGVSIFHTHHHLMPLHTLPSQLRTWWSEHQVGARSTSEPETAATVLTDLVADRMIDLPLPGGGQTAERFAALASLGELDLTVGRLAEAHCDAIAILTELGACDVPGFDDGRWAVWAAEPPTARVTARIDLDGQWRLTGRKAWCSGAGGSTHALVTAAAEDGPRLFACDVSAPEITSVNDPWPAAALSGTDTRSVSFDNAAVLPIGGPRDYLDRAGFWHGAAGVAAVWYGGAIGVANALRRASTKRALDDIDHVHVGAVDARLWAAHASLLAAAHEYDTDPLDHKDRAAIIALRTRAVVEGTAAAVVNRVGRALGPSPLAVDGEHARRVTDLTLYVRQSHADRDLADLGSRLDAAGSTW